MIREDVQYIYMNRAQQYAHNIGARDTRIVASRRTGKTVSIADKIAMCVTSMPRSAGIFLGNSEKQLKTRTVPAMLEALEKFVGWKVGRDVWWGKPPKKLNVPSPYIEPKDWSNVISFFNGTVIYLVSLEVVGSANSLTVNFIIADEARFLKKKKLDADVMPTMSGIPGSSELTNPHFLSTYFVSDAALTLSTAWLEAEEEKMQLEVFDAQGKTILDNDGKPFTYLQLRENIEKLVQMYKQNDRDFRQGTVSNTVYERARTVLTDTLDRLRCRAFNFCKFSTLDNLDIVGIDYIKRMKRELPPLVFAISIMNMTRVKTSTGFYANFRRELHCYTSSNVSAITAQNGIQSGEIIIGGKRRKMEYEGTDPHRFTKIDCRYDGDIDRNQCLRIALDYNSNINWIGTGQIQERRVRCYTEEITPAVRRCAVTLKSMFVKYDEKLRELLRTWHNYYKPHQKHCKEVMFYYNNTGKQGSYATNAPRFYEIVIDELTSYGWDVLPVYMGNGMNHEEKYMMINDGFTGAPNPITGEQYLFPLFNEENNDELLTSIENAEAENGYRGFRKDKREEKRPEREDGSNLLEWRTDGSDMWDDLYIGMNFYPDGAGLMYGCSVGMTRSR